MDIKYLWRGEVPMTLKDHFMYHKAHQLLIDGTQRNIVYQSYEFSNFLECYKTMNGLHFKHGSNAGLLKATYQFNKLEFLFINTFHSGVYFEIYPFSLTMKADDCRFSYDFILEDINDSDFLFNTGIELAGHKMNEYFNLGTLMLDVKYIFDNFGTLEYD